MTQIGILRELITAASLTPKVEEGIMDFLHNDLDKALSDNAFDKTTFQVRKKEGKVVLFYRGKPFQVIPFQESLQEFWSGDVDTKWQPKEGIFTQSAEAISDYVAKESKDLQQAMSRIGFYVNRAGANLSSADKSKFEKVKELLHKKFGSQ